MVRKRNYRAHMFYLFAEQTSSIIFADASEWHEHSLANKSEAGRMASVPFIGRASGQILRGDGNSSMASWAV
jgi:hypothetical protein